MQQSFVFKKIANRIVESKICMVILDVLLLLLRGIMVLKCPFQKLCHLLLMEADAKLGLLGKTSLSFMAIRGL